MREFLVQIVAPLCVGGLAGWVFARIVLRWLIGRIEWMGTGAFRAFASFVFGLVLAGISAIIIFNQVERLIVNDLANSDIDGPSVFMAAGFVAIELSFMIMIGAIVGCWFGASKRTQP